jgi:hypothetical protein
LHWSEAAAWNNVHGTDVEGDWIRILKQAYRLGDQKMHACQLRKPVAMVEKNELVMLRVRLN